MIASCKLCDTNSNPLPNLCDNRQIWYHARGVDFLFLSTL